MLPSAVDVASSNCVAAHIGAFRSFAALLAKHTHTHVYAKARKQSTYVKHTVLHDSHAYSYMMGYVYMHIINKRIMLFLVVHRRMSALDSGVQ